jgi:hypothetical protein
MSFSSSKSLWTSLWLTPFYKKKKKKKKRSISACNITNTCKNLCIKKCKNKIHNIDNHASPKIEDKILQY